MRSVTKRFFFLIRSVSDRQSETIILGFEFQIFLRFEQKAIQKFFVVFFQIKNRKKKKIPSEKTN
jgi:hypothetical protein